MADRLALTFYQCAMFYDEALEILQVLGVLWCANCMNCWSMLNFVKPLLDSHELRRNPT